MNPTSLNCGEVSIGSSLEKQIDVTNAGTKDLVIESFTKTGADESLFEVLTIPGFTLAPGATQPVYVKFSPLSVGTKTVKLSIAGNDCDENPVKVTLTGTGISAAKPSFMIEEAKIDFKKKPDDDKVFVKGKFVVGGDVSGTDQVIVTIGPFSETISNMKEKSKGKHWEYNRPKGKTGIKDMKIEWKDGEAIFKIHIDKPAESDWENPVPITLRIGLCQGTETIDMKEKKDNKKWEYHK